MFLFSGNLTNIPAVLQPSSTCQWFRSLTVCCQPFRHQPIAFCVVRPTLTSFCSGYAASRSPWTDSLFEKRVKKLRGEGRERVKACRQTFGTVVPRHPLCIRSWCKLLLARTLTVDRFDLHRFFGRHVGLPSSFLASRSFAAQRSRGRALPSLNLNKKKDCLQSTIATSSSILLLSFVVLLISIIFFYQTGYLDGLWVLFFTFGLFLAWVWPVWVGFGLSDRLSNLSGRRTIEMRRRRRRENNRNVVVLE